MGAARSKDLRSRVVAEVAAGMSRRQAAARFKVSAASAVRWVTLAAQTGGVDPRPRGGKSRSPLAPPAGGKPRTGGSGNSTARPAAHVPGHVQLTIPGGMPPPLHRSGGRGR